ncbi:MAG TPA: Sec-independent protein translocase subunit TatA [Candidatus Nanopelagicales bacterium]|nr:Sec-independent protein translocase subunit TatA [Candidatus Nanopelagicales bacterium]
MGGILREPMFWLVMVVVILLFGAKRLPDVARGVGRSLRIFKAETEGLRSDSSSGSEGPAPAAPAAPQAVAAAPAAPAPTAPAAPAAPAAPVAAEAPRYLVDPVTGEQILAQPVVPPADGAPRA